MQALGFRYAHTQSTGGRRARAEVYQPLRPRYSCRATDKLIGVLPRRLCTVGKAKVASAQSAQQLRTGTLGELLTAVGRCARRK